jgi:hypothetical protein
LVAVELQTEIITDDSTFDYNYVYLVDWSGKRRLYKIYMRYKGTEEWKEPLHFLLDRKVRECFVEPSFSQQSLSSPGSMSVRRGHLM